jgi:hypothetical protein
MEIKASVDDRALKALLKNFPKETLKAGQRLVNDMAFEFKAAAPGVIDKHMEVRNKGFVSRAFRVEKAKPAQSLDKVEASAGSVAIEPSAGHGGFSGWAEQEGEPSPAFMKKRPIRSIGKNARGGSMTGLPKKRATLTGDGIIDMDDLFGPTVPTEASRAQLAIWLAAKKAGKGGRVILRGGTGTGGGKSGGPGKGFRPGLYGITHVPKKGQYRKKIKKEGDEALSARFIRVGILQEFDKSNKTYPLGRGYRQRSAEKVYRGVHSLPLPCPGRIGLNGEGESLERQLHNVPDLRRAG